MPRVERLSGHVAPIDEGKTSVAVTTQLILDARDAIDEVARRQIFGGVGRSVAAVHAGYVIERAPGRLDQRANLSIGGLIDAMLEFGFLVEANSSGVFADYSEEDSQATAAAIVLYLEARLGGD